MTELRICMEQPQGWEHQAENHIESGDICLFLANLKARKNINVKRLAKTINYYHICELLCYYGQLHQKCFLEKCLGGDKQSGCRIDWVLREINVFR